MVMGTSVSTGREIVVLVLSLLGGKILENNNMSKSNTQVSNSMSTRKINRTIIFCSPEVSSMVTIMTKLVSGTKVMMTMTTMILNHKPFLLDCLFG